MINKSLQDFFDKTQKNNILLSIALLIIVITLVVPTGGYNYIGKITVLAILGYILYYNVKETHYLKNQQKNKLSADMKTNVWANYLLCFFIFLLFIYVVYTLL